MLTDPGDRDRLSQLEQRMAVEDPELADALRTWRVSPGSADDTVDDLDGGSVEVPLPLLPWVPVILLAGLMWWLVSIVPAVVIAVAGWWWIRYGKAWCEAGGTRPAGRDREDPNPGSRPWPGWPG
jgi:hypothetical protein